jgi:hypothetical protein
MSNREKHCRMTGIDRGAVMSLIHASPWRAEATVLMFLQRLHTAATRSIRGEFQERTSSIHRSTVTKNLQNWNMEKGKWPRYHPTHCCKFLMRLERKLVLAVWWMRIAIRIRPLNMSRSFSSTQCVCISVLPANYRAGNGSSLSMFRYYIGIH